MKRIAVLISGRGSNLQAIVNAIESGLIDGEIVVVLSNHEDAAGLSYASQRSLTTVVLDHRTYSSREAFDAELLRRVESFRPDLVVLAGFMRILTREFVAHYTNRLLNIHPSLLPAFPGLHTHRRALQAGVKLHGCTVHFVTTEVDVGPILIQAAVPVLPKDDESQLASRVLRVEHRIYPQAISWFCEDRLVIKDGLVRVSGEHAEQVLFIHH